MGVPVRRRASPLQQIPRTHVAVEKQHFDRRVPSQRQSVCVCACVCVCVCVCVCGLPQRARKLPRHEGLALPFFPNQADVALRAVRQQPSHHHHHHHHYHHHVDYTHDRVETLHRTEDVLVQLVVDVLKQLGLGGDCRGPTHARNRPTVAEGKTLSDSQVSIWGNRISLSPQLQLTLVRRCRGL